MRDGVPKSMQKITQAALKGTASPRNAIKAFCMECSGWDRENITDCGADDCPLWKYRPFRETK